MFTGLIEEVGSVIKKTPYGGGYEFEIQCSKVLEGVNEGDSINVSGVCQTVTKLTSHSFAVIAVEETLSKTTLGEFKQGGKVNLERSLLASSRLGGHFVLGHTDVTGTITGIEKLSASTNFTISFPKQFAKFLVPVGSIAVDGISLTCAEVFADAFKVAIIPHTIANTVLAYKSIGDKVNLEFDVLGKYVVKLFGKEPEQGTTYSSTWLKENGFEA